MPIPSSVPLPAIVHASYGGKQSFVVSGIGQVAGHEPVLASSFGAYDGVFPVGFVDPAGDPTVAVHVATRGAWQPFNITVAGGRATLTYASGSAASHPTLPGTWQRPAFIRLGLKGPGRGVRFLDLKFAAEFVNVSP